jgi:hypothetical protein
MIDASKQYYDSISFWKKRQQQQIDYIAKLVYRVNNNLITVTRFCELRDNAVTVENFCLKRIEELK